MIDSELKEFLAENTTGLTIFIVNKLSNRSIEIKGNIVSIQPMLFSEFSPVELTIMVVPKKTKGKS